MIDCMIDKARELKKQTVRLSSQLDKVGFYEKLGFRTFGDYIYDEYMMLVPMILEGLSFPVE